MGGGCYWGSRDQNIGKGAFARASTRRRGHCILGIVFRKRWDTRKTQNKTGRSDEGNPLHSTLAGHRDLEEEKKEGNEDRGEQKRFFSTFFSFHGHYYHHCKHFISFSASWDGSLLSADGLNIVSSPTEDAPGNRLYLMYMSASSQIVATVALIKCGHPVNSQSFQRRYMLHRFI